MLSILENITIWNIVDILIVAYIFYKLFILIKETRAEQLIKGLVFIVVVMKLSEVFGLMALNYLIQSTLTVG
ncbi:MAG: TIGR00159 family protein, partial [Clostridium sp.]